MAETIRTYRETHRWLRRSAPTARRTDAAWQTPSARSRRKTFFAQIELLAQEFDVIRPILTQMVGML